MTLFLVRSAFIFSEIAVMALSSSASGLVNPSYFLRKLVAHSRDFLLIGESD